MRGRDDTEAGVRGQVHRISGQRLNARQGVGAHAGATRSLIRRHVPRRFFRASAKQELEHFPLEQGAMRRVER